MTLTKQKKSELLSNYKSNLDNAKSVVVLKQSGIPLSAMNSLRVDLYDEDCKILVVKKRLFLKVLNESSYESIEHKDLDWSVVVLYSYTEGYSPLKVISNFVKLCKKEKKRYWFEYIWWWFDQKWHNSEYVSQMADLPSKEEAVSKFLFLLNYPIQSFARVLDAIREKNEQN